MPLATARFSGETAKIPESSAWDRWCCGTKRRGLIRQAGTKFLLEGDDSEILPGAVQGETEAKAFGCLVEHAVEADFQEVKLVDNGPLEGLVLVVLHGFQIAGQVAGVAAEGGGAHGVAGGQDALRDPGQEPG